MREAVARGLDGPGISPLDVLPQTWAHCPGFEEEMEHRRRKVEAIKVHTPAPWPSLLYPLQVTAAAEGKELLSTTGQLALTSWPNLMNSCSRLSVLVKREGAGMHCGQLVLTRR